MCEKLRYSLHITDYNSAIKRQALRLNMQIATAITAGN